MSLVLLHRFDQLRDFDHALSHQRAASIKPASIILPGRQVMPSGGSPERRASSLDRDVGG